MYKLNFDSVDYFNKSIDITIEKIKKSGNIYQSFCDLIEYYEKCEKKTYKVYFYRKIIDSIDLINNLNEALDILNKVLINVNDISINDVFVYKLVIDVYVLTAIYYFTGKNYNTSEKYFDLSIEFGKKYDKLSKEDFYDALNCAYTWKAYYLRTRRENKEALLLYKQVIKNYEKVKDDPNYHVREIESVDISKKSIEEINKDS